MFSLARVHTVAVAAACRAAAQRATSMLVKPLADGSGSVAEEGAREIVRAGHRVLGEVIKRTWPPADP